MVLKGDETRIREVDFSARKVAVRNDFVCFVVFLFFGKYIVNPDGFA